MYESHNLASRIKEIAKKKDIKIKQMLIHCGLGSNTMSALYHDKSIAYDSLAKIADYLDCSMDYLVGRTDVPEINGDPLKEKVIYTDKELLQELLEEQKLDKLFEQYIEKMNAKDEIVNKTDTKEKEALKHV
ncbi:MAG: hypothetical protein EGR97_08115 [Clostridiales bacterium]|nr:hypothetical protein [Clostridiales bacterium]